MPQPNVSRMDPPFGDAFRNHTFTDQALTSTDLLGNNSDPDFMYELDREMTYTHNSREDPLTMGDCKDIESVEPLNELIDSDPSYTSNWEQWDTYWEDLTKYTKLTSCDIWGTKEVDFLGLDDFSSPYQNEEIISKTPTLAQLNCEDSQPVLDSLYHPDLLKSLNQNTLTCSMAGKKLSTSRAMPPVTSAKRPCLEACLPETIQKATKSVSLSTNVDNSIKSQPLYNNNKKMGSVHVDFVKKANVWISPAPPGKSMVTTSQVHTELPDNSSSSDNGAEARKSEKRSAEDLYSGKPLTVFKEADDLYSPTETTQMASPSISDHSQKKEEHNYSLFVSDSLTEHSPNVEQEADDEDDDEDDEDHDEGFGSEHEYSDNEDDDDDEEEEDKEDDVSDTFSEPGYDNDTVEDVKDAVTGISRKRSKRRYFWEYSEQLIPPPKQDRMLKPSEWDRDTLPSNMYQKNGLHHGKYLVKKSRRTDVEDLTPNPRKLLQIGNELRKLNKVISDLTPVSELPITARPRSRKEKNKLASRNMFDLIYDNGKDQPGALLEPLHRLPIHGMWSVPIQKTMATLLERACRLKKKAQYEANKVKLWGLNTEYDRLLYVINSIKQEIVNRVQSQGEKGSNMLEKLEKLLKETLGTAVAGQTSDFVNQVLEKTGEGDPTGGLDGLRVPTSKV